MTVERNYAIAITLLCDWLKNQFLSFFNEKQNQNQSHLVRVIFFLPFEQGTGNC